MRDFRVVLLGGAVLVAVLAAFRLFPVSLICAAMLMPVLTLVYFYDVDVYESEPWRALAATVVWGAVAGVGVGLIAHAVAPHGRELIDKGSTAHVVTGGVLLPLLGVALMLLGPLALLREKRFNEVLDGATFGSATAAAFAAAQVIVVGVDVLGGGLRPAGAAAPWVLRLLALAVATPTIAMSAIGATAAAIWLRYRSPAKDRRALGALGSPPIAISVAALLIVAGAIAETFLPAGALLAVQVLLAIVALLLLRRAIHVGLLEEAAEIDIGPQIRCANCGEMTARHTFCGNCGISLRALPKTRDQARGASAGRLGTQGRLLLAALGAALVAGAAVAAVAAHAPPPAKTRCKLHAKCGAPPITPHLLTVFPGFTGWQSSVLGYSLRYDDRVWSVANQTGSGVELEAGNGEVEVFFRGAPQGQLDPSALLDSEVSALKGQLLGFKQDRNTADQILGANVGLRPGSGGVYDGAITSPQGPQTPVSIAIMSAGDGRVSIAVVVVLHSRDPEQRHFADAAADDVIDSVEWGP